MKNQRSKFSIPKGVTYLNCAYMSPLPKSVEKAGMRGMKRKRNPFEISARNFFDESEILRKEFAKLIGTRDDQRVAILPSASYGLSTAARNIRLGPGQKIIVAAEQFPSNYYPWRRLCQENGGKLLAIEPPATSSGRGKGWNERILSAIDSDTRVVAIGNVHWADGTKFDLGQIRKRTMEVGSLLIIDGTQSVGALPLDVQRIKPDVLVCAGYKWLLGPYSLGVAYYGEAFDNGLPIEENWINRLGSEDFAGLVNYRDEYQGGSLRYDVGEHSNFTLLPMLIESIRLVNNWKPVNTQAYCREITAKGVAKLRSAGFWVEDDDFRAHHIFGIRFPAEFLLPAAREKIQKKKIAVSFRGNSLRVSPHVYNVASDFDRLVKLLIDSR